ncbi:ribokinase [Cohnella yongneupensis]|uniref:Ribokinase n=1 Tax=Cohnella yongneupensis TaxID=425006 RepID=A0ABW0R4R6_9BACL
MSKQPKIAVIGSLNMDIVVEVDTPPQAGETKFGSSVRFVPGGKGANQAYALAKLGANTTMVGAVGQDAFGDQIIGAMRQAGVHMDSVKRVAEAPTGVASILLAEQDNRIIVIPGANGLCMPSDVDANIDVIANADVVLVQLEIPMETVIHAVRAAKRLGKTVIVNPAPARALPETLLREIDYLTPNQIELGVVGGNVAAEEDVVEAMRGLQRQGVRNVVTTLGAKGCAFVDENGESGFVAGYKVDVVDTTGAGDAFNAGLAYAIASGSELPDAVRFAGKVAALSVTKFGAQGGMPDLRSVLDFRG